MDSIPHNPKLYVQVNDLLLGGGDFNSKGLSHNAAFGRSSWNAEHYAETATIMFLVKMRS